MEESKDQNKESISQPGQAFEIVVDKRTERKGQWWAKKLEHNEILSVLQWIVEGRTNGDIADLVKEHFDKDVTRQNVWQFRHSQKWKPVVEKLRENFAREIFKLPIATKQGRVFLLQKILDQAMTWSLKTITKDGDEIYELKLGDAARAVQLAREEMEGIEPLIKFESHKHFHLEKLSDEELLRQCREKGIGVSSAIEDRIRSAAQQKPNEVH